MAEDYNQQVAGSSWWDSSRTNRFYGAGSSSSSPSSSSTLTAATGSYGSWLTESTVDIDMRSSCSSDCCSSSSSSAVIFPADNSHRHLQAAACSMLDPSTLQIMGVALSSASSINDHWNHYSFLGTSNKAVEESSFLSMLKEGIGRTTTNFTTDQEATAAGGGGGGGGGLFGSQKIIHCEEESFNELGSSSSVMYSSPSSNIILQGLAISNHQQQQHHQHHQHQHQQQQQQQRVYNPNPGYMNYQQHDHEEDDHLQYGLGASGDIIDSNLLPASWSTKVPLRSPNQLAASTSMTEYMPPSHGQLQFNNSNAQFWNSSTGAIVGSIMSSSSSDVGRPSFYPSIVQSHLAMPVPLKQNNNSMESRGTLMKKSSSAVSGDQAAAAATKKYKRTRNHEASTTLPPYKLQVRKEKMGDRITALQQLVSPFGKTDTASVLTEAIEYIKFLHEQVNVLSTPYLKSGASIMQHHQNINDKLKDKDGPRQDLKSQGLCLVPVSSTFPLAHETTVDFWTPAFGGTFR